MTIADIILHNLHVWNFGIPKSDCRNFILRTAIILDSIWYLRHDVVHNQFDVDSMTVIQSIQCRYLDHSLSWSEVEKASGVV